MHELVLDGPEAGKPFIDVTLAATFGDGEQQVSVPGFYDGAGTYRIRFSTPDFDRCD